MITAKPCWNRDVFGLFKLKPRRLMLTLLISSILTLGPVKTVAATTSGQSSTHKSESLRSVTYDRQDLPALFVSETIFKKNHNGETVQVVLKGVRMTDQRVRWAGDSFTFTADQITLNDARDLTKIDVLLVDWLIQANYILPRANPRQVIDGVTDLTVSNLTVTQVSGEIERRIALQSLQFGGIRQVEGQVIFSSIDLSKFEFVRGTAQSILNPLPQSEYERSTIDRLVVRELDGAVFEALAPRLSRDLPWPKLSAFKLASASLTEFKQTSYGFNSRAVGQPTSVVQMKSLKVTDLDFGTAKEIEVRDFGTQINKPNKQISLSAARMIAKDWSNRPYVQLGDLLSGSSNDRTLPGPKLADLWPGGPLDIGIGHFDLGAFKIEWNSFSATLSRFAVLTKRLANGQVVQFEIPRADLRFVINQASLHGRHSRDFASMLARLKLDQINVNWRALLSYDRRRDIVNVRSATFALQGLAALSLKGELEGVERARKAVHVYDFFAGLMIQPNQRVGSGGTSPPPPRSSLAELGKIGLKNAFLRLDDFGIQTRIFDAWAQRRRETAQTTGTTSQELRERTAQVFNEQAGKWSQAKKPWSSLRSGTMLEAIRQWLALGGAVSLELKPQTPLAALYGGSEREPVIELQVSHKPPNAPR
jgi:hypothetical protein